ncbi:MAG: sodium:solute symporter family protein [Rhodospirillaceae bacterium]|nr:sodium:solute symporter family protein [Rhodospirillaceae bacterium]
MSLSLTHLLFLIGTITTALILGVRAGRGTKTAEGFSLGGRSSGVAMIAGGIAGTVIGGAATIGTAQLAYNMGLSAWWFTLGSGIGFILIGTFYARPLRHSGLETISQFLVLNYGRGAGPIASLASSLGILFSAVASALSAIPMIGTLFGLSSTTSAIIIVVLVIGYVAFGGMKGAGIAGLFKLAVIWFTLFASGGVAVVFLVKQTHVVFPTFPWFSLFGRGTGQTFGNLFSLIVGIICTQTYIQALYAASDSRTAAIGAYTAALITIPVGLPSVAIGMAMHISHPDIPPILALPLFLLENMPPIIAGIGIGGLMLSVVGSIAGLTLGIGTMISRDIGQALFGLSRDRDILRLNRGSVLIVTIIAAWIAVTHLDSYVLDWNYMSMALRGAGIFIPLSLAIFAPKRLPASWAVASMAISTVAAIASRLIFAWPINPLFIGVAVSTILVGCGLLHARITKTPITPPPRT